MAAPSLQMGNCGALRADWIRLRAETPHQSLRASFPSGEALNCALRAIQIRLRAGENWMTLRRVIG